MQRRQMTTVADSNVHNIAVEGDFDAAQSIVKQLFDDAEFRERTNLTAVNSINLVRILAQSVYYFTAAAALGAGQGRAVNFAVPTGNFGDVFAGEAASRMGVPMGRLIVATNTNDILVRALSTGDYAVAGAVQTTFSPSMDIQVASNFERALFEAVSRDAGWVQQAMSEFRNTRGMRIPENVLRQLSGRYIAERAGEDETLSAIRSVWQATGHIVDPHTAVGLAAHRKLRDQLNGPVVALATAHPAKFPEAISRAIGRGADIPESLAQISQRDEHYEVLPNSASAVGKFILERLDI
jgi:threonine synthase